MDDDPPAPRVWNLPNCITFLRLLATIAGFALLAARWHAAALVLMAAAMATDWLDGYLARRLKQVTKLGRVLDPLADKVLICGTFIFLCAEESSGIPAWIAAIVVVRELTITALRSLVEQEGGDFSSNLWGKLKMLLQCAVALAGLALLAWSDWAPVPRLAVRVVFVAAVCAAWVTLASGGVYVRAAWPRLRG